MKLPLEQVPAGQVRLDPTAVAEGRASRDVILTITRPILVNPELITCEQWQATPCTRILGPGSDALPVSGITWLDAIQFCNATSAAHGLTQAYYHRGRTWRWEYTAAGYRLPTEAEWLHTYSCLNLPTTPYHGVANGAGEWCGDRWGPLPVASCTDPRGAIRGTLRVIRRVIRPDEQPCYRFSDRSAAEWNKTEPHVGLRIVRNGD